MSRSQRASGTVQYGIREFDLSIDRESEQDYELIQAPNTRLISMLDVPDECRLHLGTAQSPGLDLRDYSLLERETAFGQLYLSNPTSSSGTLRLLFGVDLDAETEGVIESVESIQGTVETLERSPSGIVAFSYSTSSTSAEQLPSNTIDGNGSALVQADDGNSSALYVGNSSSQPYRLDPGESVSFDIDDTSRVYVNADSSGDSVNVVGEN
jgi:hypothetical protein